MSKATNNNANGKYDDEERIGYDMEGNWGGTSGGTIVPVDPGDNEGGDNGSGGNNPPETPPEITYTKLKGSVKDADNGFALVGISYIVNQLYDEGGEDVIMTGQTDATGSFTVPFGLVGTVKRGYIYFYQQNPPAQGYYIAERHDFDEDPISRLSINITLKKYTENSGGAGDDALVRGNYLFHFTNYSGFTSSEDAISKIRIRVGGNVVDNILAGHPGDTSKTYVDRLSNSDLQIYTNRFSDIEFTVGGNYKTYRVVLDYAYEPDTASIINITLVEEQVPETNITFIVKDNNAENIVGSVLVRGKDAYDGSIISVTSSSGEITIDSVYADTILYFSADGYESKTYTISSSDSNSTINITLNKTTPNQPVNPDPTPTTNDEWHLVNKVGIPWYLDKIDLKYTVRDIKSGHKEKFIDMPVNIGSSENMSAFSPISLPIDKGGNNLTDPLPVNKIFLTRTQMIDDIDYSFTFYVYKECFPAEIIVKNDQFDNVDVHRYYPTNIKIQHRKSQDETGSQYYNYSDGLHCIITASNGNISNYVSLTYNSWSEPRNTLNVLTTDEVTEKKVFTNVLISPDTQLGEEERTYIGKLSAKYGKFTCHAESYTFGPDDEGLKPLEFIYDYPYSRLPEIGKFKYTFTQDGRTEEVDLDKIYSDVYKPKLNIYEIESGGSNITVSSYLFKTDTIAMSLSNPIVFKDSDNSTCSFSITYNISNFEIEDRFTQTITYTVVSNPEITIDGLIFNQISPAYSLSVTPEIYALISYFDNGAIDSSTQQDPSVLTLYAVTKFPNETLPNDIVFSPRIQNGIVAAFDPLYDNEYLKINVTYNLSSNIANGSTGRTGTIYTSDIVNSWAEYNRTIGAKLDYTSPFNVLGYYYALSTNILGKVECSAYSYTYLSNIIDATDLIVSYNTSGNITIWDKYNGDYIESGTDRKYRLSDNIRITSHEYLNRWAWGQPVEKYSNVLNDTITNNYNTIYDNSKQLNGHTLKDSIAANLKNCFEESGISTYIDTNKVANPGTIKHIIPMSDILLYDENDETQVIGSNTVEINKIPDYVEDAYNRISVKCGHTYIFDRVFDDGAASFFESEFHSGQHYYGANMSQISGNKYNISTVNLSTLNNNNPNIDFINSDFKTIWVNQMANGFIANDENWENNAIYDYSDELNELPPINDNYITYYYDSFVNNTFTYGDVSGKFNSTADRNYHNIFVKKYEELKLFNDVSNTIEYDQPYTIYVKNGDTTEEVIYQNGLNEYVSSYADDPTWQAELSYAVAMSYVLGFSYSFAYENINKYSYYDVNADVYPDGDPFYMIGDITFPSDFYPYLSNGTNISKKTTDGTNALDYQNIYNLNDKFGLTYTYPDESTIYYGEKLIKDELSFYTNYVNNVKNSLKRYFMINRSTDPSETEWGELTDEDILRIFGYRYDEENIVSIGFGYDDSDNSRNTQLINFLRISGTLTNNGLTLKDGTSDLGEDTMKWITALKSCYYDYIVPVENLVCEINTTEVNADYLQISHLDGISGKRVREVIAERGENNFYYLDQHYEIKYIPGQDAVLWENTTTDWEIFYAAVQADHNTLNANGFNAADRAIWDDPDTTNETRRNLYESNAVGHPRIQATDPRWVYYTSLNSTPQDIDNDHLSAWATNSSVPVYYVPRTGTTTQMRKIIFDCTTTDAFIDILKRYADKISQQPTEGANESVNYDSYKVKLNNFGSDFSGLVSGLISAGVNDFNNNSVVYIPQSVINSFLKYKYYYINSQYVSVTNNYRDLIEIVINTDDDLKPLETPTITLSGELQGFLNKFGYNTDTSLSKFTNLFKKYYDEILTYLTQCNVAEYLDNMCLSSEYVLNVDINDFEIFKTIKEAKENHVISLNEIYGIIDYILTYGPKIMIRKHLMRALLYGLYSSSETERKAALQGVYNEMFKPRLIEAEITEAQKWIKEKILSFGKEGAEDIKIQYGNDDIIEYNYDIKPIDANNYSIHSILCNGYNIYYLNDDLYLTQVDEEVEEDVSPQFNVRYLINTSPDLFTNTSDIYKYNSSIYKFTGTIRQTVSELSRILVNGATKLYLHILIYYYDSFLYELDITNKEIPMANSIRNVSANVSKNNDRLTFIFNTSEHTESMIDQTKQYSFHIALEYWANDGDFEESYRYETIYNNDGYKFNDFLISEHLNRLYTFRYRICWDSPDSSVQSLYSDWKYLVYFIDEKDEFRYEIEEFDWVEGIWDYDFQHSSIDPIECKLFIEYDIPGDSNPSYWYLSNIDGERLTFNIAKSVSYTYIDNGEETTSIYTPEIHPDFISNYPNHEIIIVDEENKNKIELV